MPIGDRVSERFALAHHVVQPDNPSCRVPVFDSVLLDTVSTSELLNARVKTATNQYRYAITSRWQMLHLNEATL